MELFAPLHKVSIDLDREVPSRFCDDHKAKATDAPEKMAQDAAELASEMVKLVSAEGHEFYINKKCAMTSGTIRAMLSGQFTESKGEISFPDISAPILEKVCQYMYYKTMYTDSTTRFPDFVIEPEIAMELLMAANYLDC